MIEYRRDSIARALVAKGYHHFSIRSFRVFGQVVWEVTLHHATGEIGRVLGGPAANYPHLIAQIAALPPVLD